jgi:putative ABC transport system permease protein
VTAPARWKKVGRDIAAAPFRTLLAVVAMAAGSFGLSMILTAYTVLTRELATTYRDTRPASAILDLDRIDDAVVAAVRQLPGVSDAEARPTILGRIQVGQDEWAPLVLFVMRDFDDLRIDKIGRDTGAWPPRDGEVLLERSGLPVARAGIGDSVTVEAGGAGSRLIVTGTVHAPGLAPGWMDHVVSGFVSWRSLVRGATKSERAALRIVVDGDRLDERHIRQVAAGVEQALARRGIAVQRLDVPKPGRHPHADQMSTFLFLLGAFAALTLLLSAVLVVNMVEALLTEQLPQVGVMKAIGASSGQVAALYLAQVAALAMVAIVCGWPLGVAAGRAYARFAGTLLNASIVDLSVPLWVTAAVIAVAVGVPLLVALGPVYRASRISILCALGNDKGRRPFGTRRFDRWLARIGWLPRPLMLSLRSTFHRRGRLVLTVGTLAVGGAVFMAALNVSAGWESALETDADAQRYDIDLRLSPPARVDALVPLLAGLPSVTQAEYWSEGTALLVDRGGAATLRVSLIGPDRGTALLHPRLLDGRWLAPQDDGVAVVNQALLASDPRLHVGGNIVLRHDQKEVAWRLVGVSKEINPTPTVYAPRQAVLRATGEAGDITHGVRIVSRLHDEAAQLRAQREIELALKRAGIGVFDSRRLLDHRKALADHLVIIKSALMLAAWLVILVGGLGLTATLSINVAERTHEFGILGALGATPRRIACHVVVEAFVLGVLSWLVAVLIAAPTTVVLDAVAGKIFIKSSLDFFMSAQAVGLWLALVLILGAVSSFLPARRAARLTVREALAHA